MKQKYFYTLILALLACNLIMAQGNKIALGVHATLGGSLYLGYGVSANLSYSLSDRMFITGGVNMTNSYGSVQNMSIFINEKVLVVESVVDYKEAPNGIGIAQVDDDLLLKYKDNGIVQFQPGKTTQSLKVLYFLFNYNLIDNSTWRFSLGLGLGLGVSQESINHYAFTRLYSDIRTGKDVYIDHKIFKHAKYLYYSYNSRAEIAYSLNEQLELYFPIGLDFIPSGENFGNRIRAIFGLGLNLKI